MQQPVSSQRASLRLKSTRAESKDRSLSNEYWTVVWLLWLLLTLLLRDADCTGGVTCCVWTEWRKSICDDAFRRQFHRLVSLHFRRPGLGISPSRRSFLNSNRSALLVFSSFAVRCDNDKNLWSLLDSELWRLGLFHCCCLLCCSTDANRTRGQKASRRLTVTTVLVRYYDCYRSVKKTKFWSLYECIGIRLQPSAVYNRVSEQRLDEEQHQQAVDEVRNSRQASGQRQMQCAYW